MPSRSDGPTLWALILCGGLVLAAPARAQTTAATGGTPGPAPAAGSAGMNEGAGEPAAGAQNPANWMQQQLDRLHRQLKVTPAQEPAWTQYAEATRANSQRVEQLYQDRAAHFESMSAVENLKNYQDIMQAQAEGVGKRAASFQALYDTLSPEQRQAADRTFRYQEERRELRRRMARRG